MSEQFGVIGLAVMGENLALNLAAHRVEVAVYNRTPSGQFIEGAAAGRPIYDPAYSLAELVAHLEQPQRVLLMVKAGPPVDAVLQELVPHLDAGDLVIDGDLSLPRHGTAGGVACPEGVGVRRPGHQRGEYGYGLDLAEIARIWTGGCIIRAALLDDVRDTFRRAPRMPNLLLDPGIARGVADRLDAWHGVVEQAQRWGIPVPAFSAALAYLDGYRSPRLPSNLVQAQRDYFGAHTYPRTDRPGSFHTEISRRRRRITPASGLRPPGR